MRRTAVALVTAFALGLLAAFAASCTQNGVKGGLPQTSADDLKAQIHDVQEFVDGGRCDGIDGQLRQVQQAIDNLPESTDERLVDNLRQGADQLQTTAIEACNAGTETQTQTQTQPPETVTEAIPTVTETVPTAPETTPTTPPDTTPTAPPETTPAAPSDTTGGAGVTP